MGQLIPRTLQRELVKLWYFVSRGMLVLIILVVCFFIPGLNLVAAIIGALWAAGAWRCNIQTTRQTTTNWRSASCAAV
ncbi:hypothetical protein [Cellvibrio sp. PSBB023]|uniref:hypothetical protein n=1 Tax=Cellvibrio sp. PSBB023 TaxID=1945512 RepID=UPI001FF05A40|nr:hypothetical protein [Cellvibrio sp. PSBB023]